MKIGSLVKVKTKSYGTKIGLVIEHGTFGYYIQPADHSRMIFAQEEDCEVISE